MLRALAVSLASAVLAAPATAAAEWHITPMIGLTFAGKTTIRISSRRPATASDPRRLGHLLTSGVLGVEGIATLTPGFFSDRRDEYHREQPRAGLTIMGNVVVTAPRRWTE